MQNYDSTLQQVEVHIEHAREIVAFGDAIDRLATNKDFQLVIDQGYMTQEARRLTMLSASPNITEETRAKVMQSIQAIGELYMFFQLKRAQADEMRKDLVLAEEELEKIHSEGDDAAEVIG